MNRSRGFAVLLLLVVAMLAAGCSGVPRSSSPQTVKAVGFGAGVNPGPGPPRGENPRDVVQGFLNDNWGEPTTLATARKFLTPQAARTWSPTSKATVVTDPQRGTYTAKGTVTVTARALGTLNADGSYTPSLTAGEAVKFTYGLDRSVDGQYRINQLQDGLVITADNFNRYYFARPVYFYDAADQYLVPFVRYSALTDQTQLANWLLNGLANPPEPQTIVSQQGLPPQAHRLSASVTGAVTRVQIAGSGQLDPELRDRLAAQVSQTLAKSNVATGPVSIFDGTTAISVPSTHGTVFSANNYTRALGPPDPPNRVNYLVGGRIVDENGKPLAGPVNNGRYSYTSVALASRTIGSLAVAAVIGSGSRQQLLVGTTETGMRSTAVPGGALSRPAWAPGRNEVWVGDGPRVYLVDTSGRTPVVRSVPSPAAAGGGRIVALRLSPDGARIAMVVSGSNDAGQLYIGSVVRGAGSPQVVNLQPISPSGAVVTDVAWDYALRVTAIGYVAPAGDAGVFDVGVDGANWADSGTLGLPATPASITATADAAWVSADGFVWIRDSQSGSSWVSPGPTGQTAGTSPVYLS